MAADELLRLAWEADHDGRPSLRDALLTLAIAESGPEDDWPERCRARLMAERPGHYLGNFPTVRQALNDPRVVAARDRLRRKYPADRVSWLLLRARAARGTFTGRLESLAAMIEDLAGPRAEIDDNFRRDAPEPVRGPLARARAPRHASFSLAYPPMTGWGGEPADEPEPRLPVDRIEEPPSPDPEGRRFHYYSILFAIAMLLAALPVDKKVASVLD